MLERLHLFQYAGDKRKETKVVFNSNSSFTLPALN